MYFNNNNFTKYVITCLHGSCLVELLSNVIYAVLGCYNPQSGVNKLLAVFGSFMEPGNSLKIESLNEEWRDKDSVMLHACFQLLKDTVEKEKLFEIIDWDADEKTRSTKQEITELYNWWLTYNEDLVPEPEEISEQNRMLHRLIDVRWALWT